jgi:phospholipase C
MSKSDRPKSPRILRISRRTAATAIGAIAGSAIAGCGDDGENATSGAGGGSGSGGGAGDGGAGSSSSKAVGSTGTAGSPVAQSSVGQGGSGDGGSGPGAGGSGGEGGGENACTQASNLTPEELLAGIDTFVILCMENRSFDHYLGSLSLDEGAAVDGLTGDESNLDGAGNPVPVYRLEDFTPDDPPHTWDEVHAQWNDGANDGFVTQYEIVLDDPELDAARVMGYHTRDQIPITYALADNSAICDRYFCSVLGPTWPNRFYLHGATSDGEQGNFPNLGFDSIWDAIEDAGLTGVNYYHDIAWATGGYAKFSGNEGIEEFFEAASLASLPNVSIIDPQFFGDGANDDHPDHHIALGQALIASIYNALAASTQWERCLFIITYDEHGGFYDHVPPPAAVDERPEFAQYGFRVPTLVTGPFVRRGCAVSTVYDHCSILKTLAVRFGLPMLTDRMAAAADMSDCIDPAALQNPHQPIVLPEVPVPVDEIFTGKNDPMVRPDHHTELWDLAESGAIPPHLDRRAEGDRIAKHVLEVGHRLGAVRFVRTR